METLELMTDEQASKVCFAFITRFSGCLTVSLGRSTERFEVRNMLEASEKYSLARDISGLGGSQFPDGVIYNNGKRVARISYNGRVWDLATGKEIQVNPDRKTAEQREAEGWA